MTLPSLRLCVGVRFGALCPWLLLSLSAACSSSAPALVSGAESAAGASSAGASSAGAPSAGASTDEAGAAPSAGSGDTPAAAGSAPVVGAAGARAGGAGAGGSGAGAGGAAAAGASNSAGAAGLAPFPPLTAQVMLHVAGDSTAAIFPATDLTGRVGWAAVAQALFSSAVTVDDAAQSGRSSKSFIAEGFWTSLKTRIHSGDYVFIEFGHNDEKTDDPDRYTDPATTYRTYLKTYVSEARALGGYPVLLTPISRKNFTAAGAVTASHGAYPAAVIAVGTETGTPVIDMTDKTRVWLEGLGPVAAVPYFATGDNTHLSALGAPVVAKLVMGGVTELGLPIAQRLVPSSP